MTRRHPADPPTDPGADALRIPDILAAIARTEADLAAGIAAEAASIAALRSELDALRHELAALQAALRPPHRAAPQAAPADDDLFDDVPV